MKTQTPQKQQKPPKRKLSPQKWLQQLIYHTTVRKTLRRLSEPSEEAYLPTQGEQELVLTGLVLGFVSLVTAIFPICGFPIAITGLLLGLYGRNMTTLRTMASWAVALSSIGLLITFIYLVFTVSIYFSTFLWP